jgi:DNA polymerase-2
LRGWILDLYPGNPGEIVVWLKLENGETKRFVDRWTPSVFVASDDRSDLEWLTNAKQVAPYVLWSRSVKKYEQITDQSKSEVLEFIARDAKKNLEFAKVVERLGSFGRYRIYNADVPPNQMYLYEHDLFPLAHCEVSETAEGLSWKLMDDVWALDYRLPTFRSVSVEVVVNKEGRIPKFTDPIGAISVESDGERVAIDSGSEQDKILGLMQAIERSDPDLLFTEDGDAFLFPYLITRAEKSGVERFALDRDSTVLKLPAKPGTSYFSYGKILFKPSAMKLYGRVHLDMVSSFVCNESGSDGLFELSRICRLPLQTSSRASIGKALSSLQFYHATKQDTLIPWKPILAEHFKDRSELLVADRGGFIFEPKMGLYESVAELDFSALYPNIMLKKNISAETVRCSCCPDSSNRIPELDWNVCKKRTGIVPRAMEIIVGKRLEYKKLKKTAKDEKERGRYDSRQAALKWIGVCSFGYLGFNNAKFGRIDAHIGVCAWDRKILVDSVRIAERRGFGLIHGIVDSLWVKKENARESDYQELVNEIEAETEFEISFEGVYKWIAFVPSKVASMVPVLNRYFGAYRNGELKVRGIEARRHDTPPIFSRCQMEILSLLAKANSVEEAKAMIPDCVDTFTKYAGEILRHEAPVEQMVFTRNISKKPDEYANRTLEAGVAKQLTREGVELHAGEQVRYVVTDYYSTSSERRAVAFDLVDGRTVYDSRRYIELLAEVCSSILESFDKRCRAEQLLHIFENRNHILAL